jgi:hypothetical protein
MNSNLFSKPTTAVPLLWTLQMNRYQQGKVKKGADDKPPTSYWIGIGGAWLPLPVYGTAVETGIKSLSALEAKAFAWYKNDFPKFQKRVTKPGGFRKELKKQAAEDLITALFVAVFVLVVLLAMCGMNTTRRHFAGDVCITYFCVGIPRFA